MNVKNVLLQTKSFEANEVHQLFDDLVMEFDPTMVYVGNRSQMNQFGFIAWFLRNYTYSPMSLIEHIMEISPTGSKGAATSAVIRNFEASCFERPCSLDGGSYDNLQVALIVFNKYYAPNNKPLDRQTEDVASALLYMAHLSTGFRDKGRTNGGTETSFTTTPKEPLLVTVLDMLQLDKHGAPIEDLCSAFESHQLNY